MKDQGPQDKVLTQYKLAILYLLDICAHPLSTSQICDVLLEDLFKNFFHLQMALDQLIEAGMVQKGKPGSFAYYSITESGHENFSYLKTDLSLSMRRSILANVKRLHLDSEDAIIPSATWQHLVEGGTLVRLTLTEGTNKILDLTLAAPGPKAAKSICEKWSYKSHQMYEELLEKLLS